MRLPKPYQALLTRTAAEVDEWLASRTARARGKLAQLVAARNATAVEVRISSFMGKRMAEASAI